MKSEAESEMTEHEMNFPFSLSNVSNMLPGSQFVMLVKIMRISFLA